MPEVEMKTLSFRAEPWLAEWITVQAQAERRTVGAMIRVLLERMAGSQADKVSEGGQS